MKITSKNGKKLNFIESGVNGIYVLDRVAFEDKFDEENNNDWDKSSGKKRLQEWAERNLPQEILDKFDIDLPTVEEVFPQKMLNLYESSRKLKSKQFRIFQNRNDRIMKLNGKRMWWWTRSIIAGLAGAVWRVYPDGDMCYSQAKYENGFVPVLRRKK